MPTGPSTSGPRHLAARTAPSVPGPRPRRRVQPPVAGHTPAHRVGAARRTVRLPAIPADAELVEVPAVARVKRSRLAFATAVTVAALPILVADNLPATAEPEQVAAVAEAPASTTSTTQATTSTTAAPTTTLAPATTAAPTTTEAPTTTATEPEPAPTTTTTTAPARYVAPPPSTSSYGDPDDPATWDRLAQCESGGNWALDNGNGYYGGLQFSLGTWQDVGGTGYPHEASREEQIRRGQILQERYGWGQWPHCSAKLGYQ